METKTSSQDTRIMYVRDAKQRPVICIAYSSEDDGGYEFKVKAGYSLCYEGDQFEKAMGRHIALGRLVKSKKHNVALTLAKETTDVKQTKRGPQPAREEVVRALAYQNEHTRLAKQLREVLGLPKHENNEVKGVILEKLRRPVRENKTSVKS